MPDRKTRMRAEICLGWPARCLYPNDRTDRRAATKSRQAAKMEGWAEVAATLVELRGSVS